MNNDTPKRWFTGTTLRNMTNNELLRYAGVEPNISELERELLKRFENLLEKHGYMEKN